MKLEVKYSTMIVKDMEQSIEFYRDIMGFEVESQYRPNDDAVITLMKQGDGAMIELIQDSFYNVGLYSIGIDVDDLDQTLAELQEKHVRITMKPVKTSVGKMAFVKDPNGVNLALIQHDKPQTNPGENLPEKEATK